MKCSTARVTEGRPGPPPCGDVHGDCGVLCARARPCFWIVCLLLQVTFVVSALCNSPNRSGPDYLAEHFSRGRLKPGGSGVNNCRLLVWNVPASAEAGDGVVVEIGWQFLQGDPGDMTAATVMGEWQPDDPIFGVLEGFRDEPGTVVARRFTFKAPQLPGRYGLRWFLAFQSDGVTLYRGKPPDPDHPTGLVWAEAVLNVTAPPPARSPAGADAAPRDWLVEKVGDSRLRPGGPPVPGGQFRLLTWDVPKTVHAGETMHSSASWQSTEGNPNACVYVTVIGDWDPEKPLTIHHGYQGEPGWTVAKTFAFLAPKNPGKYRLRWILTQAFKPISIFYGKEHNGADDPGLGIWAEAAFEVIARTAPVQDSSK